MTSLLSFIPSTRLWTGKSEKDWTNAVRARERKILLEAKKIETSAITEIEKALTGLEK